MWRWREEAYSFVEGLYATSEEDFELFLLGDIEALKGASNLVLMQMS